MFHKQQFKPGGTEGIIYYRGDDGLNLGIDVYDKTGHPTRQVLIKMSDAEWVGLINGLLEDHPEILNMLNCMLK